jgi:hypothetical protein
VEIEGYTAAACRPVGGDGAPQPVRWEAGELGSCLDQTRAVPAARGPVRLRFQLKGVYLYPFCVV